MTTETTDAPPPMAQPLDVTTQAQDVVFALDQIGPARVDHAYACGADQLAPCNCGTTHLNWAVANLKATLGM